MIIIYIFTHLFIYPGILKPPHVFSDSIRGLTRQKKKKEKRGNLCTEQTAYGAGGGRGQADNTLQPRQGVNGS